MEKKSEESSLVVESALSPVKALEMGAMVANVRGKIGYTIHMLGARRWKVTLAKGTMEELRKAVGMSKGMKVVQEK